MFTSLDMVLCFRSSVNLEVSSAARRIDFQASIRLSHWIWPVAMCKLLEQFLLNKRLLISSTLRIASFAAWDGWLYFTEL